MFLGSLLELECALLGGFPALLTRGLLGTALLGLLLATELLALLLWLLLELVGLLARLLLKLLGLLLELLGLLLELLALWLLLELLALWLDLLGRLLLPGRLLAHLLALRLELSALYVLWGHLVLLLGPPVGRLQLRRYLLGCHALSALCGLLGRETDLLVGLALLLPSLPLVLR